MMKAYQVSFITASRLDPNLWITEEKKDGSRDMWISGKLQSIRGIDHKDRYPKIYEALSKRFGTSTTLIDGEIAIPNGNILELNKKQNWSKAIFYVFDLITYSGTDWTRKTLTERQEMLKMLVATMESPYVKMIPSFDNFNQGWSKVIENDLEGLMLKKKDSYYVGAGLNLFENIRSENWLKLKNLKESLVRVIDFENGSVKGAFKLEGGGKVSALASGVGEIFERNRDREDGVFAEIIYQFRTNDGICFQPRLKRLVGGDGIILWEAG